MSILTKLKIIALDIRENNYIGAKMSLGKNRLFETIDNSKTMSDEKKAKTIIFLQHHIQDDLKDEYITKQDHADFWQSLKRGLITINM